MRCFRLDKVALLTLVLFSLASHHSAALEQKPPQPPIKVGGFEYQFIERGEIHMNVCKQPACVPGSKVSYILYAPESKPDFAQFKQFQKTLETQFKARLPKGATVIFGTPKRETNDLYTAFTNTREQRLAIGRQLFTTST